MPRYIAILFALPLLLSCSESAEAKLLAQKKAEEIELENARKAEAEFEAKLKAEYEKKFGVPISDFELSITKIEYIYYDRYPTMSITRTVTGAIAKYDEAELELDMGEWLDFLNALHKCNIREKKFRDAYRTDGTFDYVNKEVRELKIQLSSLEELLFGFQPEWPKYKDWTDVAEIMDSMVRSIIKRIAADIEPKLEAEYEKKFGIPISDFERSIRGVYFRYKKDLSFIEFSASRTATGAYINYIDRRKKHVDKMPNAELDLTIDIGEWLDFLNALNRFNVSEWKKEYIDEDIASESFTYWQFNVYFLEKKPILRRGVRSLSPNWTEFKKVMDDFEAKIKSKAETK